MSDAQLNVKTRSQNFQSDHIEEHLLRSDDIRDGGKFLKVRRKARRMDWHGVLNEGCFEENHCWSRYGYFRQLSCREVVASAGGSLALNRPAGIRTAVNPPAGKRSAGNRSARNRSIRNRPVGNRPAVNGPVVNRLAGNRSAGMQIKNTLKLMPNMGLTVRLLAEGRLMDRGQSGKRVTKIFPRDIFNVALLLCLISGRFL